MRISELATHAGVSTAAIRFYERIGVISCPPRTKGDYRDYDSDALKELAFVRAAQALGLTLREIEEVVAFRDRGQTPCSELIGLMERHLHEVERRLDELERIRSDLRSLLATARRSALDDCTPDVVYQMVVPETGARPDEVRAPGPPSG